MKKKQITALFLAGTMLAGCAQQPVAEPMAVQVYPESVKPLAAPVYPEMAGYPDEQSYIFDNGDWDDEGFDAAYEAWYNDRMLQREKGASADYLTPLNGFFRSTAPLFLSGNNGENRLYSPANVYMALSMLSEITDGETQAQLLSLLGFASAAEHRKTAQALWNANYSADGALISTLANSLWLRSDTVYNSDVLKTLADSYYAYTFSGEMGSEDYDSALQGWVDRQTGGLLSDSAENMKLLPETVIALVSTMYFRAKWSDEFVEANTYPDVFYAQSGDVECDFMHATRTMDYYYTDGFDAVKLGLIESGGMWLILPDEGKTAADVLVGSAFYELLEAPSDFSQKFIRVEMSIPKFDVNWSGDLSEQLAALGVTDAFDSERADFSPLTEESGGLFLSNVQHSVRVAVDEEGVTAAAFTEMAVSGAALPPDEIAVFNLNRPFIFVITGNDGAPLFAGAVNCP